MPRVRAESTNKMLPGRAQHMMRAVHCAPTWQELRSTLLLLLLPRLLPPERCSRWSAFHADGFSTSTWIRMRIGRTQRSSAAAVAFGTQTASAPEGLWVEASSTVTTDRATVSTARAFRSCDASGSKAPLCVFAPPILPGSIAAAVRARVQCAESLAEWTTRLQCLRKCQ